MRVIDLFLRSHTFHNQWLYQVTFPNFLFAFHHSSVIARLLTTQRYEKKRVRQFSKHILHRKSRSQKQWHRQRKKAQAQKQETDLKSQRTGLKPVCSDESHNSDPSQKELSLLQSAIAWDQKSQTPLIQKHKSQEDHKGSPPQNTLPVPSKDFEGNSSLSRQQKVPRKRGICGLKRDDGVLLFVGSYLALRSSVYAKSILKPRKRMG